MTNIHRSERWIRTVLVVQQGNAHGKPSVSSGDLRWDSGKTDASSQGQYKGHSRSCLRMISQGSDSKGRMGAKEQLNTGDKCYDVELRSDTVTSLSRPARNLNPRKWDMSTYLKRMIVITPNPVLHSTRKCHYT